MTRYLVVVFAAVLTFLLSATAAGLDNGQPYSDVRLAPSHPTPVIKLTEEVYLNGQTKNRRVPDSALITENSPSLPYAADKQSAAWENIGESLVVAILVTVFLVLIFWVRREKKGEDDSSKPS